MFCVIFCVCDSGPTIRYKQLGFELLNADHDGVFKIARLCRLLQEFEGLEEQPQPRDPRGVAPVIREAG